MDAWASILVLARLSHRKMWAEEVALDGGIGINKLGSKVLVIGRPGVLGICTEGLFLRSTRVEILGNQLYLVVQPRGCCVVDRRRVRVGTSCRSVLDWRAFPL